jgi:hypothetical protein
MPAFLDLARIFLAFHARRIVPEVAEVHRQPDELAGAFHISTDLIVPTRTSIFSSSSW